MEESSLFLHQLGREVRTRREQAGLSQRGLAQSAGLSTRFVSQLEGGKGNISILRLVDVCRALGVPLHELVRVESRERILALIGLRGAGKSTIGARLAKKLRRPFVELDARVEEHAGLSLEEIFALHGERYYRRVERDVLSRVLTSEPRAVLATGGSLVTDEATFTLLSERSSVIWLKAQPELHLSRVAAQGDRRPMAGRADPLAELRLLLREREPLYAKAALTIDTSGRKPDAIVRDILAHIDRSTISA